MSEGNAAIQSGGRAACSGGWGYCDDSYCRLCNHSNYSIQIGDGFWTKRNTCYLKQVMAGLPYIKNYFFKTLIVLKVTCFRNWLELSWIQAKILGRYAKNWIFHQNNIFCSIIFQSQCMALNHAVCKMGLMRTFTCRSTFLCGVYPEATEMVRSSPSLRWNSWRKSRQKS